MVNLIINLFKVMFEFLKLPLFIVTCVVVFMVILVIFHYFYLKTKGYKVEKSNNINYVPKRGFFQKLFYDFPHMMAYDMLNKLPDTFCEHGLIIFTGRQGRGKTISMTEYLDRLKDRYSKMKCITNFGFTREDDVLEHWRQLIEYNNGHYGVAVGIDETQNWFSSGESKNFPP